MSAKVTLGENTKVDPEQQKGANCELASALPWNSSSNGEQEKKRNGTSTQLQQVRGLAVDQCSDDGKTTPRLSPLSTPKLSKRFSDSKDEFAMKLQKSTSQIFSIGSFAPFRRSSVASTITHLGSDPVLDTISQLNEEDRTDRDLCCGMFANFRSALKALWMLFSVAVVYSGFMGPHECQKITLIPVFVTSFGFILMLYMVLGEIAGTVAIWKGRRIGLCILALSQIFLAIWILLGYVAIPIVRVDYSGNVTSVVRDENSTTVTVNRQNFTGNCHVPHLCDCFYFNYMVTLWGFAHVVLVLVLLYSIVVCMCVAKAAHEVRKHDRKVSCRPHLPKWNHRRGSATVTMVDIIPLPTQQESGHHGGVANGNVVDGLSINESAVLKGKACV